MSIVLLEPIHAEAQALLAAYGPVVELATPSAFDQIYQTPHVEALITRGRGQIRQALLANLPDLRVVARCGVGLDNLDVQAAAARGIPVVYAPGSTTTAVAEHTLLLMLALARRLITVVTAVRSAHWAVRNTYTGMELSGKTLGIVGMGAIGQRVAQLATALGMRVIYYNRHPRPGLGQQVTLAELLSQADVVSLHIALTPATQGLIGPAELAQMKPGALLINTARGALVDQQAVHQAVHQGTLGGYAADVLAVEPPPADEALLGHEQVVVTPHLAALTAETYRLMCVTTVQNVLAILRGQMPTAGSVYQDLRPTPGPLSG